VWTVILRDGTNTHPATADPAPLRTEVDKAAYPTQQAAVQQAARQLGIIAVGPAAWWEVY
jgi:hypothetical protein